MADCVCVTRYKCHLYACERINMIVYVFFGLCMAWNSMNIFALNSNYSFFSNVSIWPFFSLFLTFEHNTLPFASVCVRCVHMNRFFCFPIWYSEKWWFFNVMKVLFDSTMPVGKFIGISLIHETRMHRISFWWNWNRNENHYGRESKYPVDIALKNFNHSMPIHTHRGCPPNVSFFLFFR